MSKFRFTVGLAIIFCSSHANQMSSLKGFPIDERSEPNSFYSFSSVVSSTEGATEIDVRIAGRKETALAGIETIPAGIVAVSHRGAIDTEILSLEANIQGSPAILLNINPPGQSLDILTLDGPSIWRELRVVSIYIKPVFTYEGNVYELNNVRIRIINRGGIGVNEKKIPIRPISPMWERIYRSNILNFEYLEIPRLQNGSGNRYIIISRHRFTYQTPQFAEWKTRQGYGVHQVTLEDLGYSDPLQPQAIDGTKRYLMEAYTDWEIPPEFVLLVGDMYAEIPSGSIYTKRFDDMATYSYYDQWYTLLDGPDLFPDVVLGRFPDTNITRLDYMIEKSIDYEMNPYNEDDWQKNAVMTGLHHIDPDHVTMQTKREIADSLSIWGMNVAEFYQEQANPANLIPLINQGLTFYNYRGDECAQNDWGGTFSDYDVQYISNARKLGIWTILSCYSARVSLSYHSTAEALLRYGHSDPSNPQGAVAFVGSQGNSYYVYNNAFDMGFYRAFSDEEAALIGEAFVSGKGWAYSNTSPGEYKNIMMKEYTILGDPSLQIWTDRPQPMVVSWDPSSIPSETEVSVSVSVNDSTTMQPISEALVCLYRPGDVYAYGYTDENGISHLPVYAQPGNEYVPVMVTVTGLNSIPFFGEIPIVRSYKRQLSFCAKINKVSDMEIALRWEPISNRGGVYSLFSSKEPYLPFGNFKQLFSTPTTRFTLPIDLLDSSSFFFVISYISENQSRYISPTLGVINIPLVIPHPELNAKSNLNTTDNPE